MIYCCAVEKIAHRWQIFILFLSNKCRFVIILELLKTMKYTCNLNPLVRDFFVDTNLSLVPK
jgi:hypothetical protein